jgi:hypothetical protein
LADLAVEDDRLVLHLTRAEKLEGTHRDLQVPLAAIREIEVLDDAHGPADRLGFKIGARIPGVIEVGTVQGLKRRLFAAVHRDTPRGIRITFEDASFDEWIVGCPDPEQVAAQLRGLLFSK